MRWGHIRRAEALGYGPDAITLVSTPLYSNTTLVSLIPALVRGGTVILMRKFDARGFLELVAEASRHPRHAGAGAVSPPDGPSRLRQLRPVLVSG